MEKNEVTSLVVDAGGIVLGIDENTGWYKFPNEEATLELRNQIPFITRWGGGVGVIGEMSVLTIYFDKVKNSK